MQEQMDNCRKSKFTCNKLEMQWARRWGWGGVGSGEGGWGLTDWVGALCCFTSASQAWLFLSSKEMLFKVILTMGVGGGYRRHTGRSKASAEVFSWWWYVIWYHQATENA